MGKSSKRKGKAAEAAEAGALSADDADVRSTGTVESRVSSIGGLDAAWGDHADEEPFDEPQKVSASALDDLLEMLSERRASTREAGLAKLVQTLLRCSDPEFFLSVRSEALPLLLSTLRNPSAAEGAAAVRAIAVLCVLLGPDGGDETFGDVAPVMRRLVTRCEHTGVRAAALRALALACFARGSGYDDDGTADNAISFISGVFKRSSEGLPVPDDVCATALESWGLLVSAAPPRWVNKVVTLQNLQALVECLDSARYSVRAAAAENLALLHEFRLAGAGGDGGSDGGGGGGEDENGDENGAVEVVEEEEEYVDEEGLWAEALASVEALAGETSKRMSREGRKQQRQAFREMSATLAEDELPEQTVSLLNGSLDVHGWAQVKQVAAVRGCLLGGFQLQLQCNYSLRGLLGVGGGGGTAGPKLLRGKGDGATRARTTERTRSRASRQSAKDHFLFQDDEG